MSAFDSNRDGWLDAQEQTDRIEQRFADTNADGALNISEFSRVEGESISLGGLGTSSAVLR